MKQKEFEKRLLSSLILIPLSFFIIIKGTFLFGLFLAICFLITSYEWYMMSKKKNYHVFGYFFLIFSFYTTFNFRNNTDDQSFNFFLLAIITCVSTDIGGYIFGKIFKGPKLTRISPKKTYAGMIGGYIISVISIYFFMNFLNNNVFSSNKFTLQILILVLTISTISQIGDIIISMFKRLSKIKDTGNIIPGHGGLLDRIDGMLFAIPFSYVIFSIDILK